MKGRQVAERGQQNPGQFPAQAKEAQWPQAGVWTRAETQRGRQKEGRADRVREEEQRDTEMWWRSMWSQRNTETAMWTDTQETGRKTEKGRLRDREETERDRLGWRQRQELETYMRRQDRDIHRIGIRTKACSEIGMGQRLMETGSVRRG